MMKYSKEVFVKRWLTQTVGAIAIGSEKFRRVILGQQTSMQVGETLSEMQETARSLLERMYDDLGEQPKPQNGKPTDVASVRKG